MALLRSSTTRIKQHRGDEQRPLDPAVPEPQAQGNDDRGQGEFLAKGRLLAEGAGEALHASREGAQDAGEPAGFVSVYGSAVGFHVRSSCFAARTSSRRRTGMVCGALVTRSGSCSASRWICDMASRRRRAPALLSVSVGSISRHSGTSSGKVGRRRVKAVIEQPLGEVHGGDVELARLALERDDELVARAALRVGRIEAGLLQALQQIVGIERRVLADPLMPSRPSMRM